MNQKFRLYLVKSYILLLIFLWPFNTEVFSQQISTNQQRIGIEEGLPQSYVTGITQDRDGFIWLSTLDGLSRYDGKGFKNFSYRAGDSTGLAANAIHYLLPQTNNVLSLFYDGVLADDFDMRSFKVSHYTKVKVAGPLWHMAPNRYSYNGKEWVMIHKQGIAKFDPATDKSTYLNTSNGLYTNSINTILRHSDGRIYLLSEDGVQVSDPQGHHFTFFRFPGYPQKVSTTEIRDYYWRASKMAILPDHRLVVLDRDRLILWDLPKNTGQIIPIPKSPLIGVYEIHRLLKIDAKGQPYFNHEGRIMRLNQQGVLETLWTSTENPELQISAFYIDRSDVLWVSVNSKGLFKIDLRANTFQSHVYRSGFIAEIIGKFGFSNISFPHWATNKLSSYLRQAKDSKGNIYFCYNSYNHNEVFQIGEQGIRMFKYIPNRVIYTALLVMPNGEVRIFDSLFLKWYCWKSPDAIPYTIPLVIDKIKGLEEIVVKDYKRMRGVEFADASYLNGYVWISTYAHGLLKYNGGELVEQFTGKQGNGMLPKGLTELCPDPWNKHQFWLGSFGGGLILWDTNKGLQKTFTTDDGLPNNTIYCILPDKAGKLWCSTNKGIFRFDPKNRKVELTFDKADGLSDNEFNRALKFAFPNGELAFGGLTGYTVFNPADFRKIQDNVQVQLTALQINNQLQDWRNPDHIIKEPLSTLSLIELPYDKNFLRFEFAAMLFNKPQKIKYRYQLIGIDEAWVEIGINNSASYPALPPGRYTLRLNATDNNGIWSDTVRKITVVIHPPWWATWWAYLLYTMVIVVSVWRFWRFREQQINIRQRLSFEQKEAERLSELNNLKNNFFANVSHEFRTPLTLILNPVEELIQQNPSQQVYQIIHRNAKRLYDLVNQLLEITKLEAGQTSSHLVATDLIAFFRTYISSFTSLAQSRQIALTFTQNKEQAWGMIDRDKTEKILSNLLSNAFKFTENGKQIKVHIDYLTHKESVCISVQDEGIGISSEQLPYVFDRFYQADSQTNRAYEGTGIGLALVKELVNLLEGRVEVQSRQGVGTKFTVTIPSPEASAASVPDGETPAMSRLSFSNTTATANLNQGMALPSPDGRLLLIVDDNTDIRNYLRSIFEQEYQVIEAGDGLEGMAQAIEYIPDIIISDLMMPRLDGLEFCRLLKDNEKTSHIPIVMLTAKANLESRLEGLTLGADDYLLKPFNAAEVKVRIQNLIRKQEKLRHYFQGKTPDLPPSESSVSVKEAAFIAKAKAIMEDHLSDSTFNAEIFADIMSMSQSQLLRKLKALTNQTINEFLRDFRLQRAAELLTLQTNTVSEVAFQTGFESLSYFTKMFKEKYGKLPSEYNK